MKKQLFLLIFFLSGITVFAQNVKPFKIDLNAIVSANDDKSMTYDKASRIITVKRNYENQSSIGLWLDKDISNYNIIRIKYKSLGDYGFHVHTCYKKDPTADYWGDSTYCPSYLTEMVIPIKDGVSTLEILDIMSVNHILKYKFRIDEITLEKISNPQKIDIAAPTGEAPIIDTATSGKFNDSISAWDFVAGLGAGFHYDALHSVSAWQEFGLDCYHWNGAVRPTKEIIQTIRNRGFKTLRLQVASYAHLIDENYTIDPRFMKIVKQVVDWAIEEDMYVIVCGPVAEMLQDETFRKKAEESVHYAGYSVDEKNKKESLRFLKAIWLQYAKTFNNTYDEHLIFETLNEPINCFHEHDWHPQDDCAVCKKNYSILKEYNQAIVDTIRSTGGNNTKRFIMVEGYSGAEKSLYSKVFSLPKDKVKDKLIPTFHCYPMGCGKPYSKKLYQDSVKANLKEWFATYDKQFFLKHIPVYMSEGFHDRSIPVMERINCLKDFFAEAKKSGRSCGVTMINDGDYRCQWNCFGYLSFQDLKWYDNEYVDTLIYGCEGKEYPLSDEFVKKNTLKIESIVGKNLISEPVEKKNFDDGLRISPEILVRSTPAKYKFEFEIETTGSDAIMQFAFTDSNLKWREVVQEKNVKIQGGTLKDGWCIEIKKSGTVSLSIDEKLAKTLEESDCIFINGRSIIIKSVKVVE